MDKKSAHNNTMKSFNFFLLNCLLVFCGNNSYSQIHVLDSTMHFLRNGDVREWSAFPLNSEEKYLQLRFTSNNAQGDQTLSLRQYDVKQNWPVSLNDRLLGSLEADEKDMITYHSIPAKTLRDGQNILLIKCHDSASDDIKVGSITLDPRPITEVLSEATVEIQIVDNNTNKPLPSRITIVNSDAILQTVSSSMTNLAIRPGFVYTAAGKALLHFPAGTYKIYVGRGFEYGIDSVQVELKPGDFIQKTLRIKREVDTHGWISSDTHVHTFTHSGHGDATIEERAITIAGEGIELPIVTDHNTYVDLVPAARETKVLNFFTPIVGDELTTSVGHFNVFKTSVGTAVVDHRVKSWDEIVNNIGDRENSKVIILNHARDIHNGFRPFGSERHLSSAGMSIDDWEFPANAMEVINSGSQQTDILNLYRDWFGMLNRGNNLTPVGSSDSHDVSRYIVGQGRTYVKVNDRDPGNINTDSAIQSFLEGRVLVSLGLMTKITVNNAYGPGDIVPGSKLITVAVEVHGPAWTKADHVSLYANGKKIREEKIQLASTPGLKWKGTWEIPLPAHDIFLVAIAEGPGDGMPYWPIAKPYQPASPDWIPRLMGSTGAVWIDADKNGERNAAHSYAKEIINSSRGDMHKIITLLSEYDEAVAIQVAALHWKEGKNLASSKILDALKQSETQTKDGFKKVINEVKGLEKKK